MSRRKRRGAGLKRWAIISVLAVVGVIAYLAVQTITGAIIIRRPIRTVPYSGPPVTVPRIDCPVDTDGDGANDLDEILAGARADAANRPRYRSAYYQGGYPPDDEGVCTDVIWRALKAAGHNLKDLVDADIAAHVLDYPRVMGKPDGNIDFRRVPNLVVFFRKYATALTTDVRPGDATNLAEWQGGDIVVFGNPLRYDHIAIVSDRRRDDGVPLLIHNYGTYTREDDMLLDWPTGIAYHFRFPKWERDD
ncbi:MAG: DUF1287 domain-containing protein [Chloroflexota bacterium]